MPYSAVINYVDRGTIPAKANILDIPDASTPDMTTLLALVTSLHSYINAGVMSYALLQWTEAAVTGPLASATGSNCDKALINFSYVDSNSVTQYGKLWIPNPDLTAFEFVTGAGYRMTAAKVATLQTAMSTATGLTIKINEAKLEYKERLPGVGAKNDSCLAFEDEAKNIEFMSFGLVSSSAALATFGAALNTGAYTQSILGRSFYLAKTEAICIADFAAATGVWDTVEKKAFVKMTYMDGANKKIQTLMLPGIKQTNCEYKAGTKGWKITKAVGDGIALALTAFYGSGNRELSFIGSRVDVKDHKAR